MAVLDVVSRYRGSETIFKKYDEQAGECICCQALFKTLREVAEKYGLDLERLLKDLETFVNRKRGKHADDKHSRINLDRKFN